MRKTVVRIIIWVIGFLLLCVYSSWVYRLTSGSYNIDEDRLYRLDTFRLLNTNYAATSGRDSVHNYRVKLELQSTTGYSFFIEGNMFAAVTDKKKLADTLMHNGLAFVPFTTEKYFTNYKQSGPPAHIKVFQLQIGNTKYVDIQRLNESNKKGLMLKIFIPGITGMILLIVIGVRSRKKLRRLQATSFSNN